MRFLKNFAILFSAVGIGVIAIDVIGAAMRLVETVAGPDILFALGIVTGCAVGAAVKTYVEG